MIKKHVFALSLALFTAGTILAISTSDAEADTKPYHHTHKLKKRGSVLDYFKPRAATHKTATVTHKSKKVVSKKTTTKVASRKTKTKVASTKTRKQPVYVAGRSTRQVNALAAAPVAMSRHGAGTIGVADDYIGMSERRNKRQLQGLFNFAFNHKVDPARTPWCAAFANGVLRKSGKKGTGALTAASFLSWGKRTSAPKKGDIVVLGLKRRGATHVGFYMGTVNRGGVKYIAVLGGNQGNQVKVTYYKASKVVAYRTT